MNELGRVKKSIEDTLVSLLVIAVFAAVIYWKLGDVLSILASRALLTILSYVPTAVSILIAFGILALTIKYGRTVRPKFVRSCRERIRTAIEVKKQAGRII